MPIAMLLFQVSCFKSFEGLLGCYYFPTTIVMMMMMMMMEMTWHRSLEPYSHLPLKLQTIGDQGLPKNLSKQKISKAQKQDLGLTNTKDCK